MDIFSLFEPLWPLLLLFFVIAVIAATRGNTSRSFGYQQKDALFTAAERNFLQVLTQAVGNEYRIFGKVRVADVLAPAKGMNRSNWQTSFNRIAMKHFDFVLCDPETLEVRYVAELDDKSHRSGKAQRRDAFLNEACDSAGLRIIRVIAKRGYDIGELRSLFVSRDSM